MTRPPRIFCNEPVQIHDLIRLPADEAHHLTQVLRLKEGASVCVIAPDKKEFLAGIEKIQKGAVSLRIFQQGVVSQKSWTLHLVQAIPKAQRMDWIVEKAVELGADEIFPVKTERVVKKTEKTDRWEKIARSAAQQSGRFRVPGVHEVQSWEDFLRTQGRYDAALIGALSGDRLGIDQALERASSLNSIALAIGPEGDFSPKEIERAVSQGWVRIDLGEEILRVETAAAAGLAIVNHEMRKRLRSKKLA